MCIFLNSLKNFKSVKPLNTTDNFCHRLQFLYQRPLMQFPCQQKLGMIFSFSNFPQEPCQLQYRYSYISGRRFTWPPHNFPKIFWQFSRTSRIKSIKRPKKSFDTQGVSQVSFQDVDGASLLHFNTTRIK